MPRSRVAQSISVVFTSLLSLAALLIAVSPALAQSDTPQLDSGDTAWMLTATALVLMMTIPGVMLFYGGVVRKKNVLATMMQSFAVCCLASVIWVIAGYSLAFTDGNAIVGGMGRIFLVGMKVEDLTGTVPESVFMMFQMTFAIITPALITGALVSRIKLSAMLLFTGAWAVIVYAPVAHWVWGGGFLGDSGVLDYAGGTVVHINAGVAGLVAALVIGPRRGYGREPFIPHNLVWSIIGASLLWVGWFGFNAGSAVAADGAAGWAMAVTQIAAATAALTWMFLEWVMRGKPSLLGIASGAIAGLVAITPAAGFVDPMGALFIGIAAGLACYWGAVWLKHRFGYDDSLDVFGVHGIGGIVGALLTGVFAVEAVGGTPGLLEGNVGQVGIQAYGVAVTIVYDAVATFIILKVIQATIGLRVDEDTEIMGLDIRLHGEALG